MLGTMSWGAAGNRTIFWAEVALSCVLWMSVCWGERERRRNRDCCEGDGGRGVQGLYLRVLVPEKAGQQQQRQSQKRDALPDTSHPDGRAYLCTYSTFKRK